MQIEFTEILHDLELKRAAALEPDERPSVDATAAIAELAGAPELSLETIDGGEQPLTVLDAAALAADALSTIAVAAGDAHADGSAARAIVRATTARVIARLAEAKAGGARAVTEHDLSALVEAALIDAGHYEVAKALVLRRAAAPTPPQSRATSLRLVKRSGHTTDWDEPKIETAVRKAFLSMKADPSPAAAIAKRVGDRARGLGVPYVEIETVQDIVQEELILAGHMRAAERYIVYRAERAMLRAQEDGAALSEGFLSHGDTNASQVRPEAVAPGDPATTPAQPSPSPAPIPIPVLEADGTETTYDGLDLRARIAFAAQGLDLGELTANQLEKELRRSIRPGAQRRELRRLVTLNSKSLVERDSELSRFAGRILLTYVYEEVLGWSVERDGPDRLQRAHADAFGRLLEHGVQINRLDSRLLDYDLDRLAQALDPQADLDFDYLGLQTLYDRYLIVDKTGDEPRRIETPQLFWMRVAMGIGLAETGADREQRILDLHRVYKDRRFCSSTPTLFNAGTPHSQLSSCYLYKVEDTLTSIVGRGIAENAMCSKWAGGLGGSWTAVRGTGSHIESTNGESQGVVPFLKLHNDQLVAVNQGGKRAGSGCAYLETWHNDIREFLELRRNTGDDRRRTHDMNTANWVPDLFMKRVEAREDWTLFRSNDVPDLHETYGRQFERLYVEAEQSFDRGEISGERMPALELWKSMLKMLFETGHPWITFKDPCNVRSPQDHAGVIHSSNLCTEITLNTGVEETAVCNLGSIVIDRHLDADGELDHEKLRESVRIAVRALDNVIDVNFYPTEPARTANSRHRPVGLGVMGLQYALYRKGLEFGSEEAQAFGDEMMEAIAHYAYEASSDLAAERGRYSSYAGSKWDRGLLPQDTIELLEAQRGAPVDVPRGGKLDWEPLRARIAAQGMRNSNVIAIAPTATIANIMGTSPCIEPTYKNLFAKSNLSGDFVVLNAFLVADLKAAGLWSRDLAEAVKAADGDVSEIEAIPAEIRTRYKTAFQVDPAALIDAAARRQKWIDQSQSLNLFLASPDMKAMSHMYRRAWRVGLKTTYYLRTQGASSIEKATVAKQVAVEAPPGADQVACSIEAMRNGEECEACQ